MKNFYLILGFFTLAIGIGGAIIITTNKSKIEYNNCMKSHTNCQFCETLTTDMNRNFILEDVELRGDTLLISTMFVEKTEEGLDTFALDYLTKEEYELLKKHSKSF